MENKEVILKETWKDVTGYEGLYKASSMGKVFSYSKEWISGKGLVRRHEGKELGIYINAQGYQLVELSKNGVTKMFRLHRIIALLFVPNPHNKPQVNHIDFCRVNNIASNLEWVTAKENTQHSIRAGRMPKKMGMEHPHRVLSEQQVIEIRDSNTDYKELSHKYGVTLSNIYSIKTRTTWKHLK